VQATYLSAEVTTLCRRKLDKPYNCHCLPLLTICTKLHLQNSSLRPLDT